jgi:protein TonB
MPAMKSLAAYLNDLGVQPTRILAMTTVLIVHAGLALILLAPTAAPQATRDPGGGGEEGMRITFIARAPRQAPAAPPPPPAVEPPAQPKQAEVAPKEEAIPSDVELAVPMPTLAQAEPAPRMDQSYDDGRLPFMTTEPVEVDQDDGQAPRIYGQADELPGEFMEAVDVLPMELAEYRKVRQPNYMREARDAGEQGIVIVRVLVDEFGYPVGLKVMWSTAGQLLTVEALRAISTWQFKPATRDGIAVKGALLVPVYFFLDGMPPSLKQWRAMGGAERPDAQ